MASEVAPLATEVNPLQVVSQSWSQISPGSDHLLEVDILLNLLEGYHAYADKLQVYSLLPDGAQIQNLTPYPVVQFVDFSGKHHQGLENQFHVKFNVKLPTTDDPVDKLHYDINYIACTKKFCLPLKTLSIVIPMGSAQKTITESLRERFSGSINIEEQLQANILLAYIMIFIFGVLASLTPCIYPVIPITLAVIGTRAAHIPRYQAFLLSLVHVLGIATTYSILGVIAAHTGALFGQALSYPEVSIAFAILFFAMGLSLFGFFEIRAPHFITNKLTSVRYGNGFVSVYFTGLIAGIIASPCVGPMLVSILAYIAKTQNVTLGFTLLFTFAMGMGMLLIVLGTFSSLLKNLPKSGTWMNVIKGIMGVSMIVVGIYYSYIAYAELTKAPGFQAVPAEYKNGWEPYSEQRLKAAKESGQPVIVDFYAEWCGACVELDHKTFVDPAVIEKTKGFLLLKVDATESFPELAALQKRFNVFGLPTVACVSSKGELQKDLSLLGFEGSKDFIRRLDECRKR